MSPDSSATPNSAPPHRIVSYREAFFVWCRVAILSFGGPAGQISVMHRILVEEKRWLDEPRFVHALSYCMLLPGPEAQQLATYTGWLLHGLRGGLTAGLLFILPGFVCMMLLSIAYACWQESMLVTTLFFGMKPAVVAIVAEAVRRVAGRVLTNSYFITVAALSFCLIFFLNIPFPLIVGLAALAGAVTQRAAPHWLKPQRKVSAAGHHAPSESHGSQPTPDILYVAQPAPTFARLIKVSAICLTLWWLPVALIAWLAPQQTVLLEEGLFFSKTAVVTFGGAYAVLSYIAQQAVHEYRWLKPVEMLDGLGMAETTPGPLIMVVQFVGFMGAYRNPCGLDPLHAGILGACLTTWVTFVPCFYWIFLGAPYIEKLRSNAMLQGMLSSISSAVVGVILNLTIWFSINTLFTQQSPVQAGWLHFSVPVLSSYHLSAVLLTLCAAIMIFGFRRGIGSTLIVCCILGFLLQQ